MFALAAAGVLLTGCAKIEQEESQPSASVATATTQLATEAETVPAQQYPSVALQVPEITRQNVSMKLEAEDAAVPSGCSVAMMPRLGYSGNGYLSGLDAKNDSSLVLNAEIPATQHYDITVVVGASAASTCKIQVDGETVYTMKTDATNNFMRVKIQGIFLNAGACELSVAPVDGIVDIDCIELVNNTSLYDGTSEISATPVNSKATARTQQLYQFLQQNYGSKIITGQYASDSSGKELDEIYNITGKYPLIRFADMNAYSPNGGDSQNATAVADSLAWAKNGGVVGLSWLWNAPMGTGTIYEKDTSYDLKTAVTDEDIAGKSLEELSAMVTEGKISQNCYALVSDIDSISEALQPLADADVPVLWRRLVLVGLRRGRELPVALEAAVHPYDRVPPPEQSALGLERTEQQLSGGQQHVRHCGTGSVRGKRSDLRQPLRTVCGTAEHVRRKDSGDQRVQQRAGHECHVSG